MPARGSVVSSRAEESMRRAFEQWMREEAQCLTSSSDPYPSGIERREWALWLSIALDLKSQSPQYHIGDTHVLSSLTVAESAMPMLTIPNYSLQVVSDVKQVVNTGPGIAYVALMTPRHKVDHETVVAAVKRAIDYRHQMIDAHGSVAKFDADHMDAIHRAAIVHETPSGETVYQMGRFGANVIRYSRQSLFIETGFTRDEMVFESYRAIAHMLNRMRRIKVESSVASEWATVRNGVMLRNCVDQFQTDPSCKEFSLFAHDNFTDADGNAFTRIGSTLVENGLLYPLRITKNQSMIVALTGPQALRKITLVREQADTLYALYPSLFTAPPRIAI